MELLEEVAVFNTEDIEIKCPFCQKQPIGHATEEPEKVNDKVESIPSDLNCDNSDSWRDSSVSTRRGNKDSDLPYTIAKHHLISAMQCYAQIKRLVRMGNMVGYNINNPDNGIGLPTTHHTLAYPEGGEMKKYGDLKEPEGKQRVAYALMKELGAQWHVGHHAFDVVVPQKDADSWTKDGHDEKDNEDYLDESSHAQSIIGWNTGFYLNLLSNVDSWKEGGHDEKDSKDFPHETSYDVLIIGRLFNLVKSFPLLMCEDPDRKETFIEEMNKISAKIKEHLEKFNGANPADSSPFFVSLRAYEYSGLKKKWEDLEWEDSDKIYKTKTKRKKRK